MTRLRSFSVLTVALLAGVAGAQNAKLGSAYASGNLRETLFKSIEASGRMNVESIVMRKGYRGGASTQCKFEQNDRGVSKYTVLAPLCDQNVIRYEDRRYWKNFNPERGELVVQAITTSPNSTLAIRQALAEQNYKFSSEDGDKVAGRQTMVIIAVPRASGMPSRRYSVDVSKMYVLRVETELRGDRQILTDTLAIKFPKFISISDPEREFISQFRKFELEPPVSVSDARKLNEMVGFKPSLPQDLPFGFAIIDKQAAGEDFDTVAIRISDGLANATIFQTRNSPRVKTSKEPNASRADANGFHFKLMGELPDPIMRRILEMFVREAMKGLMPLLETHSRDQLLNDSQYDDSAPMLIAVIIRSA